MSIEELYLYIIYYRHRIYCVKFAKLYEVRLYKNTLFKHNNMYNNISYMIC